MKKKILLAIMALVAVCYCVSGQAVSRHQKITRPFAERENQTLYLDKYSDHATIESKPCVIFVFGGAFARGARDVDKYIPYFDYLVDNGYAVVSIDYRLGLKDIADNKDFDQEKLVEQFIRTVDMAVEDLLDATAYVLDRAEEWNIDPSRIILNGSSAGAVTVVQAEYALCNGMVAAGKLPDDFRYAGVISFAGAIFLTEGPLEWRRTPAPMMLMHGNADLQVPYGTLAYGPMGFYGASDIAESLDMRDYPFWFYSFEDYGHEIASNPMQSNREEILAFLNRFVQEREQLKIWTRQEEIGRLKVNKDFTIEDYIRGNYDR